MELRHALPVASLLLLTSFATMALEFKSAVNAKDGIFKKGEEIVLTSELMDKGAPVKDKIIEYRFFRNGKQLETKRVKSDAPIKITTSMDAPGWTHLLTALLDDDGEPAKDTKTSRNISGGIGAIVAPEELAVIAEEPSDFDEFWHLRRAELNKVPVKFECLPVKLDDVNAAAKFTCYDVKVACAGPKPVSGCLVIPKNAAPKSLPAYVTYHPFGVYSAKPHLRDNAISFDVNAHGVLNGQPDEYYKKVSQELGWYPTSGKNDPNKYYFKDMYLRVMRALDYVKSLPEWDGKTLIVAGGSQGGGQALAAAALDPQVTLCSANVPAMGDHGGILANRKSGWPGLYGVKDGRPDDPQAALTAGYFDNVNFAKRIKGEVFLSAGFVDMIVAPTSVFAVYNNLAHAKDKCLESDPRGGHGVNMPKAERRIQELLSK